MNSNLVHTNKSDFVIANYCNILIISIYCEALQCCFTTTVIMVCSCHVEMTVITRLLKFFSIYVHKLKLFVTMAILTTPERICVALLSVINITLIASIFYKGNLSNMCKGVSFYISSQ